ncbi:unnamed protein product [Notodromas monacha]|uniref:Large ribosomal subunit protein mL51 n=1 Tax=Notodromas monacha TaxID=399045 RepID=A0A7R9GAA7_9CRUS|nr:unnamed protein product [Notodromas monacha]CAG0913804.1 unnamed protein product [Notodromas monacha]
MLFFGSFFKSITTGISSLPVITSVRNIQYFSERVAKGPLLKRRGYVDKGKLSGQMIYRGFGFLVSSPGAKMSKCLEIKYSTGSLISLTRLIEHALEGLLVSIIYLLFGCMSGLLPRDEMAASGKQLVPVYRPKDVWSERRALFGQNDYIDILGSGKVHPVDLMYNVPKWLRGFRGNEMQMLVRKRKIFGAWMQEHRPKKWMDMEKRVRYLYKRLNHKKESRRLYSGEHKTPTGPTLKDYIQGRAKPRYSDDL